MTLPMIRARELGLYLPTSFIIVASDGAPASISSQALSDMVSSPKPIIISISSSVLSDWLASNRMRRRPECIKSAFLARMPTTTALVLTLFSPLSVDCKVVKHQLLVDGTLVHDRWTEKPLPLPTHKKQARKNTTREEERLVIVEWVLPRTARELCHLPYALHHALAHWLLRCLAAGVFLLILQTFVAPQIGDRWWKSWHRIIIIMYTT